MLGSSEHLQPFLGKKPKWSQLSSGERHSDICDIFCPFLCWMLWPLQTKNIGSSLKRKEKKEKIKEEKNPPWFPFVFHATLSSRSNMENCKIPCFERTFCFSGKEAAPAVFWIPDVFLNGIQSLGQDRQEARWGHFYIFWVKLLLML